MGEKFYSKASEMQNPFALYQAVRRRFSATAILESLGEYDESLARYTILGVIAQQMLYEQEHQVFVKDMRSGEEVLTEDWGSVLDEWCGPLGRSASPFQTGVIGYIGYENNRRFEKLPVTPKKPCPVPQLFLVRYSLLFVYDRKEECGVWVGDQPVPDALIRQLESAAEEECSSSFHVLGDVVPDFTREEYIDAINRCVAYIAAGDMLPANITMRFHGRYAGDPFVLYQALRQQTPNPFFAYLDFPGYPLISTSPECFLQAENGRLTGRPIKGTVRCEINGKDQKDFLINSSKNCSENVMIADLIRNDIGRLSRVGTVEVPVLCGTKRFNQLYHLETVVTGRLKENIGVAELLKTNFPGGSISGAPKVRAMEVIDELELTERGPYCGAIGFWGNKGYLDTSIGIRIVYFTQEEFFLHAGGGIVVRSEAEDEYEELYLKIQPLLHTLARYNVLAQLRKEIDACDEELLRILRRRFDAVEGVGRLKKQWSISVFQQERSKEVLKRACAQNQAEQLQFTDEFLQELFALVIRAASERETEL